MGIRILNSFPALLSSVCDFWVSPSESQQMVIMIILCSGLVWRCLQTKNFLGGNVFLFIIIISIIAVPLRGPSHGLYHIFMYFAELQ